MTAIFRGRFATKIDPKGRIVLPSVFREQLPAHKSSFVITNSQFRGRRCLDLHMISAWENLEKKINALSPLKAEVQEFQRFYLASGQVVSPDSHCRILVPSPLRSYAHLDSGIELVGMGEKIEIWCESEWNTLFENLAENFETTLKAVAQLEDER